jgi:uncharacterized membrane protein YeaQ/YmgE (transglycosylase-associated protein family)
MRAAPIRAPAAPPTARPVIAAFDSFPDGIVVPVAGVVELLVVSSVPSVVETVELMVLPETVTEDDGAAMELLEAVVGSIVVMLVLEPVEIPEVITVLSIVSMA